MNLICAAKVQTLPSPRPYYFARPKRFGSREAKKKFIKILAQFEGNSTENRYPFKVQVRECKTCTHERTEINFVNPIRV